MAEQLSGADYDGDTVMVLPITGNIKISSSNPLPELKGFDPKVEYSVNYDKSTGKGYDDNGNEIKLMSEKEKQKEMGIISNLINDMTLKGANPHETAKAVKHSMVVIDACKHHLDYKRSEIDNDIVSLKKKWQIKEIDPDTGEVLPEGEKGELVFTSITKEAFPLLRYRTRDICVLSRKKCSCGRTLVKMAKPMGRSDDMLIIRGVNVFPSQIETVLIAQGYPPNYQIEIDRVNNTDTFDIYVEMTAEQFSDTVKDVQKKEAELVGAIKTILGINPKVHLVSPKTIARSEGKAVRVIDKRKLV